MTSTSHPLAKFSLFLFLFLLFYILETNASTELLTELLLPQEPRANRTNRKGYEQIVQSTVGQKDVVACIQR